MIENIFLVDRDKFEELAYEEVQKMQHMLFDLRLEDYLFMPKHIKKSTKKGKAVVEIPVEEWNEYDDMVSRCLGDLYTTRKLIENMQPVYAEYHAAYEKTHSITFDERMKMIITAYDSDEFERVKDRFENKFYKDIDAEEIELT